MSCTAIATRASPSSAARSSPTPSSISAAVRQSGSSPSVPGPASVKLLLGFASRLGISTSTTIAKKYGLSVANLLGKAGPENFIRDLQAGLDPGQHGVVKLHFYTFGGFKTTAEWIANHRQDF